MLKIIVVNIYKICNSYSLQFKKLKISDSSRIIESEFSKKIGMFSDLQNILPTIINNYEYKSYKVLINLISNEILLENYSFSFDDNNSKSNILDKVNLLYPNILNDYEIINVETKIKNVSKKFLFWMVPKTLQLDIEKICSRLENRNLYYGIDVLLLQDFVKKNCLMFIKKHIILMQKNDNFYRIYEVFYGYVTNYIILDETIDSFYEIYNKILNQFSNKIDEIIIDGEYKFYLSLVDKLKGINITIIDYLERLRYIDEKKISSAKKKK